MTWPGEFDMGDPLFPDSVPVHTVRVEPFYLGQYDPRDGREDSRPAGLRVLRGGSFMDGPDFLRLGLRHADRPQRKFRWNGFRLACDVPPIEARTEP